MVGKWQNDERESSNCEVRTAIIPPMTSESSGKLKQSPTKEMPELRALAFLLLGK